MDTEPEGGWPGESQRRPSRGSATFLLRAPLSAWLQELAGLDGGNGRGRAHLGTLRHRLLTVPARLVRHAGQTILRLPPGQQLLAQVLSRLRRLPIWT